MFRVTGRVKAWIDERGMGFVTPDDGSPDVFVHRNDLIDGQWLQVGDPVSFEDGWDAARGKKIAKNVSGALASGGKGCGGCGMPRMQQMPQMTQMSLVPPASAVTTPGFLSGTVRSWHDDRGMGFIAPDSGGEDIFVHRSSLLDGSWLVVGAQVVFEDSVDPVKGKRCAANVQGAASHDNPCAGSGKGCGKAPAAQPMWGASSGSSAGGGARMNGIVRGWVEARGMGFIQPSNGGEDLFVHRTFIVDSTFLTVGATVSYEEYYDPAKGKLAAKNVMTNIGGQPMLAMGGCKGMGKAPCCGGGGMWGAGGGMGGGGFGKGSENAGDNLFIAGLPPDMTEAKLRDIFTPYGAIASCRVLPPNGKPDVVALLQFADRNMAAWLVENMNGNIPVGLTSPLKVQFAQVGAGGRGGGGGGGGYGKAMTGKGGMDFRSAPYQQPMQQPMQQQQQFMQMDFQQQQLQQMMPGGDASAGTMPSFDFAAAGMAAPDPQMMMASMPA
eukprot:CAMPEP_0176207278 /NCGR_PEP_ID=MMETSP0121_2-20121125/12534_1 /TAXON_ID=160619 /ORGANISM="Kryptoperidinium foliaceum, Strain CCMP 1326" /LENGTH=495 /DNA_ID=CAMNT_0017546251 /DNA_START=38 /DNA_END=1522 /DNA_ORIENTATION=+